MSMTALIFFHLGSILIGMAMALLIVGAVLYWWLNK